MLYAKVVLPLPVEGPFDYIVPGDLACKVEVGSRVWVSFGRNDSLGFVVGLSRESGVPRLKNISKALDETPALSNELLVLTKKVAEYYSASWGEVIVSALPDALRKKSTLPAFKLPVIQPQGNKEEHILIQSLSKEARWQRYIEYIKDALDLKRAVIVLLPDAHYALKTEELIKARLGIQPGVFCKKGKLQGLEWVKAKQGEVNIVVGTRSAIFAPLSNLGLIIIEEEQDSVYKQEQVPHYHAREVAFIRSGLENLRVVLGGFSVSLESFYLAKKGKVNYSLIAQETAALEVHSVRELSSQTGLSNEVNPVREHSYQADFSNGVKVVDMKSIRQINKNIVFSKYLEDSIFSVLGAGGKVLLFLNRRGFATFAQCPTCGKILSCPRCEISLVYHFQKRELVCHHCNFKMPKPDICPQCNSGYIRYSGLGTEKIESDISRIFPSARIKRLESADFKIEDADIFVSTSTIIKECDYRFELVGVLSIDNSLHRVDFRAAEKTFSLLCGLLGLTKGRLIIQTGIPNHHVFSAIQKNDFNIFYFNELKQRKSLGFPPFKHLGMVKLRGPLRDKTRLAATEVFEHLKGIKSRGVTVLSLSPGQPEKLRGNYYYQVTLKANSAINISRFLAKNLKGVSHRSAVVTIDIDPL
ncbi:MAG: primosomal protein N' [Candidatus Omnitrophica bacterium]|nr:primosomal protein N' [Candidatus Omnitrophota bacterium]